MDIQKNYKKSLTQIIEKDILAIEELATKLEKPTPIVYFSGDAHCIEERLHPPIKEAFIHLIRNALDHGLESKEIRLAQKKPQCGLITIDEKIESGVIQIIFFDDGVGLDLQVVAHKALENRLVLEEELAKMSAIEIASFIFSPNFSTKKEASEISGRGIGLDRIASIMQEYSRQIYIESQVEQKMAKKGNLAIQFVIKLPIFPPKY